MPILPVTTAEFLSHSPEETRHLGMRLGALLQPGDALCLQGELGAGKTTFTQGLAQGWGTFDAVSSPTFIIVNVYRRADDSRLFHLDTYRLDSGPEAEELDIDAMLMRGPLVIEWPERVQNVLPDERLWITLEHVDDTERQFHFEARGARAVELLERIRNTQYAIRE
jgi:tRNA threonylcarbamoyladenosine biosynthesis protein TsaE